MARAPSAGAAGATSAPTSASSEAPRGLPHSQGGFRERLVVDAAQCVPLPDHLSFEHAVFAEPLAVATHVVGRAGPMLGRDVLITGAGPIGMLTLLVAIRAGAERSRSPTSPTRRCGSRAGSVRAAAINVAQDGAVPEADIAIEASGATAALQTCIESLRPGGRVVMVGLLPPGTVPVAGNRIVTREFELVGSFRFTDQEFRAAVSMLAAGLDVSPLLTGQFPAPRQPRGLRTAGRREQSVKVQILFGEGEAASPAGGGGGDTMTSAPDAPLRSGRTVTSISWPSVRSSIAWTPASCPSARPLAATSMSAAESSTSQPTCPTASGCEPALPRRWSITRSAI